MFTRGKGHLCPTAGGSLQPEELEFSVHRTGWAPQGRVGCIAPEFQNVFRSCESVCKAVGGLQPWTLTLWALVFPSAVNGDNFNVHLKDILDKRTEGR